MKPLRMLLIAGAAVVLLGGGAFATMAMAQPEPVHTGLFNNVGVSGYDPVAYFTIWLVVFTGFLAVSTVGLWIVTWQSGKRQSKDMTESIDVAERALVSARGLRSISAPITISLSTKVA